ncbi:MAG: YcaO-like family protein, partial [Gaiellaceae bacterium]
LDGHVPETGKFIGYGTHLHPEIAMVRALTECVQSRVIYIAGSRDDLMWLEHERLHRPPAQGFVDVVAVRGTVDVSQVESQATDSFEGDCGALVDAVTRVGCRHVVVVDLTRPDFEIPVVRVFAPGLEGYRGFGWWAPGARARAVLAELAAT